MPAESHHIRFRNSRIHYLRMGKGPEWLFCFHGYGENAGSFGLLENALGSRYTLVALDFPFHGKTDWQEGLIFEPADLMAIIQLIMQEKKPFCLMGYSMGGRVALDLLDRMPDQVTKLLLVAPDGLHNKPWQMLATRTRLGNRLFSYLMQHPKWTHWYMQWMERLGLYNKELLRFVHYYLDDREERITLYQRWTTMRRFRPDQKRLKKSIREKNIKIHCIFGKYDRVILTKHGRKFSRNSESQISITEIEAGHQLLKEKYIPQIIPLLIE
ncbi:MAG: alpha/beta hydrolase [Bacteroidota bacterium]|nr:alpha/beta hydrolase [Bacteroidota bacterium]